MEAGYFDVFHLTATPISEPWANPFHPKSAGFKREADATNPAAAFGHHWPRLLFLSGCRTGQSLEQGELPLLCEALVRAGAPAVLGWPAGGDRTPAKPPPICTNNWRVASGRCGGGSCPSAIAGERRFPLLASAAVVRQCHAFVGLGDTLKTKGPGAIDGPRPASEFWMPPAGGGLSPRPVRGRRRRCNAACRC